MADIFVGETLSLENVPQMSFAVGADNFDSDPIGIRMPFDGSFDFIVEARPTAVRVKFIPGTVQRRVAPAADISSLFFIIKELSRVRALGSFPDDNVLFFGSEFVVVGHVFGNGWED